MLVDSSLFDNEITVYYLEVFPMTGLYFRPVLRCKCSEDLNVVCLVPIHYNRALTYLDLSSFTRLEMKQKYSKHLFHFIQLSCVIVSHATVPFKLLYIFLTSCYLYNYAHVATNLIIIADHNML